MQYYFWVNCIGYLFVAQNIFSYVKSFLIDTNIKIWNLWYCNLDRDWCCSFEGGQKCQIYHFSENCDDVHKICATFLTHTLFLFTGLSSPCVTSEMSVKMWFLKNLICTIRVFRIWFRTARCVRYGKWLNEFTAAWSLDQDFNVYLTMPAWHVLISLRLLRVMHYQQSSIYPSLQSNSKLTTLPTLCITGKLDCMNKGQFKDPLTRTCPVSTVG